MANTITLTSLAPEIYAAKDVVTRELIGAIPSVTINSSQILSAAFGDKITSFITGAPTVNTSYTPAMTIPNGDDQTVGQDSFALDKVVNIRIPMTGETMRKLDNSYGAENVRKDMFAQAIRSLVNTIEAEVLSTILLGSSRANGTAGTVPFGSDFKILADIRKILQDNGTSLNDGNVSLILGSAAGAALRKNAVLLSQADSGSTNLLRNGELLNIYGFSIKESAGIANHTAGAGTGYSTTASALTVGQTTIPVAGGTVNTTGFAAGDVITIAGDANQYVIKTGLTAASGNIVLAAPGIRVAQASSAKAITSLASYAGNMAFHRSAIELAMRSPAQPYGGDAASDRLTISDPLTGLTFDVAQYKGYGMAMFDITTYYGVKVWKPDFVATLLG